MRLAIGLVKPDEGTIRIDGDYLWHEAGPHGLRPAGERHARKVRRSVGIVFQHFNLFPHMTALQNVREPLVHVLGLSRAESDAHAIDLLSQVGLRDHLDKRPAQLSGGQQQRVAIARSLALRPKVMLFDEVTSALDPELVGEVLRVVRDLAHASDMSMLIVTHEISFAGDIADRVLMFDAGKIVEEGPPGRVLKDPENRADAAVFAGDIGAVARLAPGPAGQLASLRWVGNGARWGLAGRAIDMELFPNAVPPRFWRRNSRDGPTCCRSVMAG